MTVALKRQMQSYVKRKVADGAFRTPEEVVHAALVGMKQQEATGDFAPGELMRLLEEGEESIRRYGTMDGEKARELSRRRRARMTRKLTAGKLK